MSKMTAEAKRRLEKKDVATVLMERSALMVHTALTDAFGTMPHQLHRQALEHAIDARIAYNRWYRKAWRAVQCGIEYIGWRARYDAR